MRPSTTRTRIRTPMTVWLAAALLVTAAPTSAQDSNILYPPDSIETRLAEGDFEIVDRRGSRFEGDRTDRVAMSFDDGTMLVVKWAIAPPGGEEFNNNPRYEVGAYEAQKLFLEPHEYVVPPTVMRAFDLEWYRELEPDVRPTFRSTESVIVVLQYWLFNIAGDDFWNEDRFATDTAYARHLANFNIFTYLVSHNDENVGNYLISGAADNPRIFSVDNGLAFGSETSDQGARWRRMRVESVPQETVDRLRQLTEEDVRRQLETLAQWQVEPDGTLTLMAPGPATHPNIGVRVTDQVVQLGLDRGEIRAVWSRIQRLLSRVDRGSITTF